MSSNHHLRLVVRTMLAAGIVFLGAGSLLFFYSDAGEKMESLEPS